MWVCANLVCKLGICDSVSHKRVIYVFDYYIENYKKIKRVASDIEISILPTVVFLFSYSFISIYSFSFIYSFIYLFHFFHFNVFFFCAVHVSLYPKLVSFFFLYFVILFIFHPIILSLATFCDYISYI